MVSSSIVCKIKKNPKMLCVYAILPALLPCFKKIYFVTILSLGKHTHKELIGGNWDLQNSELFIFLLCKTCFS